MRVKKAIKIALVAFLYKPKVESETIKKDGTYRFTFKLYPKPFNIALILLLLSPVIILYKGISGILEAFHGTNRVESWSSFEIFTDGRKPTSLEMYAKF